MRLRRSILALVALAPVGVGSTLAADDKPITLGAVYGLTGEWSVLDVPSARGADLFIKHANASGGVVGRPLDLVIRDIAGSIDKAADETAALLSEYPDMPVVFGLSDTDVVVAAATAAAADERVFVTSGATSPRLPNQVPTWLFLACFGDNVQAAAAAEFAYVQLGARSAAVAYDTSHTYTKLLHGYFQESFKALGGEVRSVVEFNGADRFAEVIGDIAPADVVFLAAETALDASRAANVLRQNGYDQPIVGGDGYDAEDIWRQNMSLKDIYFSTHAYFGGDHPSPAVAAFRSAYMAEYNAAPGSFAGLGYDTAGLLAAAIEKAASAAPEALLDALSTLTDFDGVTGKISFVDGSRIPLKSVTMLEVADGKRRFVAQIVPKHVADP